MAVALSALSGCRSHKRPFAFKDDVADCSAELARIEYPCVGQSCEETVLGGGTPRTVRDSKTEYWDITLEDAIQLALSHSQVMRDLGGTVIRAPDSIQTPYDPAIQETDPRFGVEAALSAFDGEFSSSLFFEKNDRRLNNLFLGDLGFFEQDYNVFQAQFKKRAATGTQFAVRKNVDFDKNNTIGNEFTEGSWNVNLETEFRHPVLQGGGLLFNRIAGPGASPGVMGGVLVARVKSDITLADFEMGLRDFVSNVENAYWDLYFSYRDLNAKIKARDTSLETWRRVNALFQAGRRGGEAEKEAQAREQFFRFEEEVQNALAGRSLEGTRTNNGSVPGTFRGLPGVQVAERRLRLLIGLPSNGDRLIRPADEPTTSPVTFDWDSIAAEAVAQRAELRRQRWVAKQRELELVASKNFLLPNLDVIGRYRWRGWGEKLLDSHREGKPRFDNAYMDLTRGDFQEWQLGLELSVPIGYRQAHSAVRNAELRVARARAVLTEGERQVIYGLSNAVADVERAFVVLQTAFNRALAARQQLAALQTAYEDDRVEFFVVLDAQRRYAEAQSRYYQAEVEYALAVRNVHFEKGSLLPYCGVMLSEGSWPRKAYLDAARRDRLRGRPRPIDYTWHKAPVVSRGPVVPIYQGQPQTERFESEELLDPAPAIAEVPDAPVPM